MLTERLRHYISHLVSCQCDLCGLPFSVRAARHCSIWCPQCQSLFVSPPRCQRCGVPTLSPVEQCGECLRSPPPWRRLYCVSDYSFPAAYYVQRLKYQRRFWYASDLARLLAAKINQPAELLVAVPLHWSRYCRRGFNQSALLTQALARQLHLSYRTNLFTRMRATRPQEGLSRKQRERNLRAAFRLNGPLLQQHIALVDDVVTTGSTMRNLCDLLRDSGVQQIDIYTICRTPNNNSTR